MKFKYFIAALLSMGMTAKAQDTTDVFSRHLNLQEVVITGLTGDSNLRETPGAVKVLDTKDLQAIAATNAIDALAHEPGISHISTGGGISKPVIRGLGYNRVVVIADGIRQEGQQWGDEHGIEFDGNSANTVEIVKGPASLMYGSDALAGVIIFHPEPVSAKGTFTGGISSEYQSNAGLASYSLYQGGNKGLVNWNVRFSDKYAHAYRNSSDGMVPGTQFRERALTARIGLAPTWGSSKLTMGYYHLTPGMTEGYEDGVLEGPTGYGVKVPFQQVRHYKAVWDNTISVGRGRIKALAGYQQNRRQEFEESPDEAALDFKLHTLNYDIKYLSALTNGWKFTTGIGGMYQKSENLGEEVLIPEYHFFDMGLFGTATRTIRKFTFSGGLRADMRSLRSLAFEDTFTGFDRTFKGMTGSLGAVYSPSGNVNIRANIARGFRAPNLSELASNGVHEGTVRYETGDSSLKPEYSLQADWGADYSNEHFSFVAALFYNRIDNYIYAARTGALIDGYHVYRYCAGNARLYGGEASLDIHPIHRLHLGLQYSYVRGKSGNNDLPLIPAPRLSAEIKWELFHKGTTFSDGFLAFRVDHHSRQNHFLADTETATPSYTLLSLSAGTDIKNRHRRIATITFIADNLTDKLYVDHLSRLKYVGLRNPGRNFIIKLEIPIL